MWNGAGARAGEGEETVAQGDPLRDSGLSRRQLIRVAGVSGATFAIGGVLAACGNSSSSGGSGGKTVTGGAAAPRASNDVAAQITELIGPFDEKNLGGDLMIEVGLSVPQAGQGAVFAKPFTQAPKLAAEQIKAMGGPSFTFNIQDNGTGDPRAGVANMRTFKADGNSLILTSYIADLGAQIPLAAQYKLLMLDPGGGTAALTGKPYFWGMREKPAIDAMPGIFKYLDETQPDVKSVAYCGSDFGAPTNDETKASIEKEVKARGWELKDFILTKVGATNYAAEIAKLRQADADLLLMGQYARDQGYFLKQYRGAGIDGPIMAFAHTDDIRDIAGSALDGVTFGAAFFLPQKPTNDWSKIFADTYQKSFGEAAGSDAAHYYDASFAMWQIIRDTLAKGGDVKSGSDLQDALIANPSFPSVFGGSGSTPGPLELSTETHSVSSQTLGVYENMPDGSVEPRAYFNLAGRDFEMVA
jgi:branched-chain amino acid transport system substrate-binding protein